MNYLLKNKPKNEHRGKIISVIVLFTLFSLFLFLFPTALRTASYTISRPLWIFSDAVARPITVIKDFFIFKSVLVAENIALKEEVSNLRLKKIDYDIISKENQDLQTELGHRGNSSRIISRVLSKPPFSPYDTFIIDTGSNQGVVPGSKVYYSDNIIIGEVSSVTPETSLVQLFSSGNRKQETILSRTGASFALIGRGGANFNLEVPKDTDILWGDVFMYPSSSSSIIGSVYYIDVNSQSAFKTVYIRVPGNIFSAEWLFIDKTVN